FRAANPNQNMLRNTIQSFGLAIQNIRANIFHTFLSVLGIVIGVAALVATFSLIDGLEKFARSQLSANTSINAIAVQTQTEKAVNNIIVRKDTFEVIDYERYARLRAGLQQVKRANLDTDFNREIRMVGTDSAIGAVIRCVAESPWGDTILTHGQLFPSTAFSGREPVAVVNARLAKLIAGSDDLNRAIGQSFTALGHTIRIAGVAKSKRSDAPPTAFIPISLLSKADLVRSPPRIVLEAAKTEDVPLLKTQTETWLKNEFGEKSDDFQVISQDFWVDEASRGFLIFRIIMGLIIGISVVVGGVGVMNVL